MEKGDERVPMYSTVSTAVEHHILSNSQRKAPNAHECVLHIQSGFSSSKKVIMGLGHWTCLVHSEEMEGDGLFYPIIPIRRILFCSEYGSDLLKLCNPIISHSRRPCTVLVEGPNRFIWLELLG